jgi:IclR helix-turn-helix domain
VNSADRWTVERGLRDSGLAPSARLVALSLLTRADASTAEIPREFSPSLAHLARDTGLSGASVKRALNTLEAGGWLTRFRDLHRAQTENLPTGYRLHLPARPTVSQAPRPTVSQGLGPNMAVPRPTVSHNQNYPDQYQNSEDHKFGEFLSLYPRQIGETAAARAWPKAVREAAADAAGGADPAAVIIDACRRFARSTDGTEPKFICRPAKWLQECRWRDDLVDAVKVDLPRKDH